MSFYLFPPSIKPVVFMISKVCPMTTLQTTSKIDKENKQIFNGIIKIKTKKIVEALQFFSGLGFAFSSLPALTMIGRYFKRKRSLANGLSRSGGAATFFLAPLIQYLVDAYAWQGCLLIIAAMELHLIACALLFRPVRLKEELEFNPEQTVEQHRQSIKPNCDDNESNKTDILKNAISPGFMARRALANKKTLKECQKELEDKVKEFGITESLIVDNFPAIEPVYKPKRKKTLDFSLLKNPLWGVLTTNLVLTQFGYSITLVHVVARAKLQGIGEYESALLLSMIGLSEVVAQLSSGAFADHGYIKRIHLHKIYIFVMAIATLFSLFAHSFASMVIYCIVFGCGSGSWQGNVKSVNIKQLSCRIYLRFRFSSCEQTAIKSTKLKQHLSSYPKTR